MAPFDAKTHGDVAGYERYLDEISTVVVWRVSNTAKGQLAALSGHYEREAIRPHVFGRFDELVLWSDVRRTVSRRRPR